MKKKSPPYAIIGAVLLGLAFLFFAFKYKQSQDAATAAAVAKAQSDMQAQIDALKAQQAPVVQSTPTNMRNVLYATTPVEAGQKISSTFYESKLTPIDILPDAYTDKSDVVGFYAIRTIEKGDPLTPRNIGKSLPYMSQRISPGMRAVALPIFNSDSNNTGGFVVDGDKVDLLYTLSPGGIATSTQLVMQNVNVLFVPGPKIESDQVNGVTPAPPPGDAISVTFEVTPEQAQALVLMGNVKDGKFSMILRARNDKLPVKVKPFVAADYITPGEPTGFTKVQKMTDKADQRVQALAQQIEAAEKNQQGSPGNTTNETPTPTPPSP